MNCEQCKDMMDASIHHELSDQQEQSLQQHLSTCEHCRTEYTWMHDMIVDIQSEFPEVTPPPQLHGRLMARLEQEPKTKRVNRWIPLTSAAVILLAVFIGASALLGGGAGINQNEGFSSGYHLSAKQEAGYGFDASTATPSALLSAPPSDGSTEMSPSMPQATEAPQLAGGEADQLRSSVADSAQQRKLIKNAQLSLETQTFDDALAQLTARVTNMGGYVQNMNVSGMPLDENNPGDYGRYAFMDLRIPADQLEAFLAQAEGFGKVTNSSQGGSDVTQQYQDMSARLQSYTVQRDRLLSIMEKADKVEDLILLESELGRIQYEIEAYTQQLTDIDRRVAESTVTINLTEVRSATRVRPVDPTLGERIQEGFVGTINALWMGIQNLLVWLVANSPLIISVLAVLAVIWFAVLRPWIRKRRMQ